jgi:hypothetical protein
MCKQGFEKSYHDGEKVDREKLIESGVMAQEINMARTPDHIWELWVEFANTYLLEGAMGNTAPNGVVVMPHFNPDKDKKRAKETFLKKDLFGLPHNVMCRIMQSFLNGSLFCGFDSQEPLTFVVARKLMNTEVQQEKFRATVKFWMHYMCILNEVPQGSILVTWMYIQY